MTFHSECEISLGIDRGSMQMVEHQMIYSPERKNNGHTTSTKSHFFLNHSVTNGNDLLTLLAIDPPSSHPEWVLLYLFSCFPHLCWVPTDSFPQGRVGQAPHPPLFQAGCRKLWIQATARCFVRHSSNYLCTCRILSHGAI